MLVRSGGGHAQGHNDRAGEEGATRREAELESGAYDPHVWLDPVNALAIVETVRRALVEADPQGEAEYTANARAYIEELRALDADFRRAMENLPSRRVVAFHSSFSYLARRYGLEIVGLVEESPGREPDARHVGELIDRIRKDRVAAVLVEPQFSPRTAAAIARDAGAELVTVDPLGDPSDPARATYLGLMRFNLESLRRGLGGAEK